LILITQEIWPRSPRVQGNLIKMMIMESIVFKLKLRKYIVRIKEVIPISLKVYCHLWVTISLKTAFIKWMIKLIKREV